MRILFLGNFTSHHCSEVFYRMSFQSLGHEVISVQEPTTHEKLVNRIEGVDLFFWVKTHGWNTPKMPEFLRLLKRKGIPSTGYHLDLYMGLQRWKEYEHGDYFQVEHFFTVDKLMADYLNRETTTKGHFLPAGVPESECFLGTPNLKKYPHEIIFTGSKNYHPEHKYRGQLIDWLHRTYGDRFAHYGGGGKETIRGKELNNLYASAKIVIGDTLCKNFTYPYYVSDRFFEVPGRGGFMIFPYITGTEEWLEPNEEVVFYEFGDFADLKNKIDHYLNDHKNREEIRLKGYERCKAEHTYMHRIEHIFKTIFG